MAMLSRRLQGVWKSVGGTSEGVLRELGQARSQEGTASVVFVTPQHPLVRWLEQRVGTEDAYPLGTGKSPVVGTVVDTIDGAYGAKAAILTLDTPAGAQWRGFRAEKGPAWGTTGISLGPWSALGGGGGGRWGAEKGKSKGDSALEGFRSISTPQEEVGAAGRDTLRIPLGETCTDILILSDSQPHALLHSLDQRCALARKAGLIGSSTPFVNGLPFTHFDQDGAYRDGAVGLFLSSHEEVGRRADPGGIMHGGLEALEGGAFRITKARGNVVVELDGGSATKRLLGLVGGRGKDARYYMAWGEEGDVGEILSGDPGRGAMAVDTTQDLREGMEIRLMVYTGRRHIPTLGGEREHVWSLMVGDPEGPMPMPDGWRGVSTENGVIYGKAGKPGWICRSPGSMVDGCMVPAGSE